MTLPKRSLHNSKLIIIILAIICCYGLYTSFLRGNANAWYFKAEFALNDWFLKGGIPSQQNYSEALDAINKAQSLDPEHPHYAHMLGRIIHWGVDSNFENKEQLLTVKNWYLKATELRPLWPDPWVDLARLNNFLQGYNQETQGYLQQALKTGPYIDLVTISCIEILLLNWNKLPHDDKALIFEQFSIAVKQTNVLRSVLEIATKIGKENIFCLQLKYNKDYKQQKSLSVYRQFCSDR